LDAAIDPLPIGANGNMRDRPALEGDECISFRIADTRKRTAEVICLAEKDLNFGFGLLALKARLSPDERLQMLAPNVTNLFSPRRTFSNHENGSAGCQLQVLCHCHWGLLEACQTRRGPPGLA